MIACKHPELTFIFPMHPNPEIRKHKNILSSKNIHTIEPIAHDEMIKLMKNCKFIISDSGGIQEEASYLNKKVIVCRKTTERPETLDTTSFMCMNPKNLEKLVDNINDNYITSNKCPYGDGRAWLKIKEIFKNLSII